MAGDTEMEANWEVLDLISSESERDVVNELDCEVLSQGSCNGFVPEPLVGVTYLSWEEVESMYKLYAMSVGFGISRTKWANNAKNERRCMTWRCECWGSPFLKKMREEKKGLRQMEDGDCLNVVNNLKKTRKSKKCQCPSMVYASVNQEGLWVIRKVVIEHLNHTPIPDDARLVKEYRMRHLTSNLRRRVLNDVEVGVPINQIHASIARERDGLYNMPFTDKDIRHVVDESRKSKSKGGDAVALMAYLERMKRDNKDFYYSMRVDVTGGMQDVFWVDARSVAAYEEFGDVVCFDTTYMTNKYELPFANFVGVNHHGQTTLFGCALIAHEDIDTFTWVFSEWLSCMSGKSPKGILTDQAPAMIKPVADVMPDTTHRWCLWHILQKLPHKLGALKRYESFKRRIKRAIYNSFTIEEFEAIWGAEIRKHKLEKNKWLSDLFEDRSMWVPAYMPDTFWAGMRTTQRVESIHSFFDKFVKSHTQLCEFGEKYIAAIEKRICQERDADGRDRKFKRKLSSGYEIERFFRDIYTDEKFKAFQKECDRMRFNFVVNEEIVDENVTKFFIDDRVWAFKEGCKSDFVTNKQRVYCLVYNRESKEGLCDCRLFETNGIICRHLVRVYYQLGVSVPPDVYVLRRWRKDVVRKHLSVKVVYHDPNRTVEVKRVDRLQIMFDKLVEKVTVSEKATLLVEKCLNYLMDEGVVDVLEEQENNTETVDLDSHMDEALTPAPRSQPTQPPSCWTCSSHIIQTLRDPPVRKKRGRPKQSRPLSQIEKMVGKSKSKGKRKKKNNTPEMHSTEESEDEVLADLMKCSTKKTQKKGTKKAIDFTELRSSSDNLLNLGDDSREPSCRPSPTHAEKETFAESPEPGQPCKLRALDELA